MPKRLRALKMRRDKRKASWNNGFGPLVVPGGVVEWLMAPVLKTGEVKASVGSNPTPSAPAARPSEGRA